MSVARFIDRAIDAVGPLLDGLDNSDVRNRLATAQVTLDAGELDPESAARCGFLLAANLLARLYCHIRLLAPDGLRDEGCQIIRAINPQCEITAEGIEGPSHVLRFEPGPPRSNEITVWASSWNVSIDGRSIGTSQASPSAICAAAAIGVGELFRSVFADELGLRGRRDPSPTAFNLVTLGPPDSDVPDAPPGLDLGSFYLVGAGAIGQAALYTLRHADVRGSTCVVDPERIALSNLQRYVLATDADEGSLKTKLAVRALEGSGLSAHPVEARWSGALVQFDQPSAVLVALDSAEDRIAVQASLPGPIYNAYTQPSDLGWSRHERFGAEPCLACLYWPTHKRPSRHEEIGRALGQPELRVLAYLLSGIAVGEPLPTAAIPLVPGTQERPPGAEEWEINSILDDVAIAKQVDLAQLEAWRVRPIGDLYREGICGGALLETRIGEVPRDVLVPVAPQSALAGVMLATQLIIASVPDLRELRPEAVEGRYNVLSAPGQILPVPRAHTKVCMCRDPDFISAHESKQEGHPRVEQT